MLHVFGDSFTDFYPDREKLNWSKILSEKLGLDLNNQGLVGCTNSHILSTLIKNLGDINPSDYVIIQISGPGRIDVPLTIDTHKTVYFVDIDNDRKHEWSDREWDIIKGYFINFHSIGYEYHREIKNIIEIASYIYKKITKKVILWNICPLGERTENRFNDDMFLDNIVTYDEFGSLWLDDPKIGWVERIDKNNKSIYRETNKEIIDYHLSEEGHQWMSQLMLKKINNEFRNII